MNTEQLYASRADNFKRAANRNNPDYVPVLAYPTGGVIEFSGKKISEVYDDHDAYVEAMAKVWDYLYADVATTQGLWFFPHANDVMGGTQNRLAPDGISLEHVQYSPMRGDEYELLIKNPSAFVKDVILPRRYPWMYTDDMDQVAKRLQVIVDDLRYFGWGKVNSRIEQIAKERYGIVTAFSRDLMIATNPLDNLFDYFRGFRGTLVDLRKHGSQVEEALEVLWEETCEHYDNVTFDFPYARQWPHIPAFLNVKQFEKYYWPYEKKIIENVAKNGNKMYILLEGKWKHLLHFFRDVPKDSCILNVDDDDVIEVSKAIGDHQVILGGYSAVNAKLKTKEENLRRTQEVLDACAPTGAFIFGNDKAFACPGDINENTIAVYEYAHLHGRY